MKKLFIVFSFFVSSAQAADRCDNVVHQACDQDKKGVLTDHTGSIGDSSEKAAIKKIFDRSAADIDATSKKIADLWTKTPGLKTTVKALNLAKSSSCKKTESIECQSAVLERTKNYLLAELSDGEYVSVRDYGISLRQIAPLARTKQYIKIYDELMHKILLDKDPKFEKEMAHLLPMVKKEIAEVVAKFLPKTKAVEARLKKLAGIKGVNDACPNEGDGYNLSGLGSLDASYDPDQNALNFCRGFHQAYPSRYFLAATLAHELSHAIDICTFVEDSKKSYKNLAQRDAGSPWSKVISCLRKPESVKAVNYGKNMKAASCGSDQANEALADFIAFEVIAKFVESGELGHPNPDETAKGLANTFRPTCLLIKEPVKNDEHPTSRDRIDRLLVMQPQLRKALKCGPIPNGKTYCGSEANRVTSGAMVPGASQPRKTTR